MSTTSREDAQEVSSPAFSIGARMAALGISRETGDDSSDEEEEQDDSGEQFHEATGSECAVMQVLEASAPQIFVMQKRLEEQQQQQRLNGLSPRRRLAAGKGGATGVISHKMLRPHYLCDPLTASDPDGIEKILQKALERRRRRIEKNKNCRGSNTTSDSHQRQGPPVQDSAPQGQEQRQGHLSQRLSGSVEILCH